MVIQKRLPIFDGDEIVLLQPDTEQSTKLEWLIAPDTGELVISVPESQVSTGKSAWAFEVRYALR